MKISETRHAAAELVSQYKINENKGGTEPANQTVNGIVAEEKVSLSSTARDFQKAQKAIAELPDVRETKVQELKDRIQTGQYDINAEKVSEKMVSESLLDIMA